MMSQGWVRCRVVCLLLAGCCVLACCMAAHGQTTPPAAPEAAAAATTVQKAPVEKRTTGVVSGVVKDIGGTVVAGAHVALVTDHAAELDTVTDSHGEYSFSGVFPGIFGLIVSEDGLETVSVSGKMPSGSDLLMEPVVMKVATASQTVEVTMTRQDIAEAEIKEQEHQRVLAVVPNFFVSYNWHAQPLTTRQKFELGWHSTLDPTHFIFSGISAGIEQAENDFPGYDCPPTQTTFCWTALGKRYGASLADSTTGTLLRGSIMPAIFHQDPRYFYMGHGNVFKRGAYALSTAVVARTDSGHHAISAGIIADFAAGAISNLYYAPSDRHGAALTFENGAYATLGVGVGHLIQEFLFKHLTHLPPQAGEGDDGK